MNGRLHLVCAAGAGGRSALVRQYVSAPMHVSKPWWDGRVLVVNAINATAGLFSGDVIDTSIEVQAGAQLLVTSPSASRAHRMTSGFAAVHQSLDVANDAWLEIHPALFIPHRDSNYEQRTAINLAPRARLLWAETVAPGRVAHGEAWQFGRYQSSFSMTWDGRPLARETYTLHPGSPSAKAVQRQFKNAYHATFYAVGGDFREGLLEAITAVHGPECWVGCTRLDGPGICVRILSADSILLARANSEIRGLIYGAFSRAIPETRRA